MKDSFSNINILTQWAFAGLVIGITMSARLLTTTWLCYRDGNSDTTSKTRWLRRFHDYEWWMHAALPIYMIHEFEEHGIDLYGNRYSFQKALCTVLVSLTGTCGDRGTEMQQGTLDLNHCPGTTLFIFFVNVGTVWIGGCLARQEALGLGLNFYGTMVVNCLVHLMSFFARGFEYNPGVLTATILFLPAAYMAVSSMLKARRCEHSDVLEH